MGTDVARMGRELWAGMRLGLVLQFMIGPVALTVFNNAGSYGFISGLLTACGVLTVDLLFVILACCGVSAFLTTPRAKKITKICGCVILVIFGLNILMSAFSLSFLPRIQLSGLGAGSAYLEGAIVTVSNPMGIVFFGGIFSTESAERGLGRKELACFAAGIMLMGCIFMPCLALVGSLANSYLPEIGICILNFIIGAYIIYMGVRVGLGKRKEKKLVRK